jgi:hypothetical protein
MTTEQGYMYPPTLPSDAYLGLVLTLPSLALAHGSRISIVLLGDGIFQGKSE